ncbi:tetraspanin family protein [Nocardiopsis sp. FIRDI 009]|uniref:tetraspanin family protein n=1 Tax=Nocardiopsis sp. FIRDI 009 TaxID=714197 RepID=UPI000E26E395|nr:tetraspanin family protein [Nocardiopsis sp. FIRDI 009]
MSPRVPGAVKTVQVLLFVYAGLSLLGGVFVLLTAPLAPDDMPAEVFVSTLVGAVGGIVLALVALTLGFLARRRGPVVRWSLVTFFALGLILMVVTFALNVEAGLDPPGETGPVTVFWLLSLILVLLPSTGSYYRKASERAAPAPWGHGPAQPHGGHPAHPQPPMATPNGHGPR